MVSVIIGHSYHTVTDVCPSVYFSDEDNIVQSSGASTQNSKKESVIKYNRKYNRTEIERHTGNQDNTVSMMLARKPISTYFTYHITYHFTGQLRKVKKIVMKKTSNTDFR